MGTKVHNLPGYYSMRDLNEESSSCGWPLFYGDKTMSNGQYYSNYLSSASADACLTYDKDVLKQTMLEHEAEFRSQVSELHRLYRIQRDLMDEVKRKELHRNKIPIESSFSTGPLVSQITTEDGQKWHVPGFPMVTTSVGARPSISGAEGFHSPLSSVKENSKQAGLFPSPNGSSSKDVEVLECRPSKARRKMFDLHLPADEYIDTEESEKFSDEKISGTTVNRTDRDRKLKYEGDMKLPCGKDGSPEDSSKCEQSLRTRNGLTDLNEPVQVEESNASAYFQPVIHNPCQGATQRSDFSSKEKSCPFDLSREKLLNRHHATDIRPCNNGYMESNGNGKLWIPSVLEEAGQAKSNLKHIPQVLKQEKSLLSSHTTQDPLSKAHEYHSDYLSNRQKVDIWRGKTVYDLEASETLHEIPTNKQLESSVSSHRSSLFAVAPPNVAKSWSHSASSWEMANSSSSQRGLSVQRPLCLNASGPSGKSSQSGLANGILADSWSLNVDSKYNPGFQCEARVQNGFYPGSLLGSKEPSVNVSSVSYDYLSRNNSIKGAPELFYYGSAKYCNGTNCNEKRPGKDINLNVMLSSDSCNNQVSQSGLVVVDEESKHEENLPVLPWLRPQSVCKNEVQTDGRGLTGRDPSFMQAASTSNKDETGKGPHGNLMQNVTSFLYSNGVEPRRTDIGDRSKNKKILGVPIFDMPRISPKKESSTIPNKSDIEAVENNRKKWVLDINLPCDVIDLDKDEDDTETIAGEKESAATESNRRSLIDLNLTMCEEDASLTTIPSTDVRMVPEIDLEAPAIPETEEDVIPEEKLPETPLVSTQELQDKVEQPQDELLRMQAAEAIVAISSHSINQVADVIAGPSESSPMVGPLIWFAEVISSCIDDLEAKLRTSVENDVENKDGSSSEGMDYFESMTLLLTETKEEDYMPKPLVPETILLEETGTTVLTTRTRRGPARRGRQRRDFQRDILPGLTSLSRHEVTEDLQTFGGLMRATGHSWSGLTRRSSSRNGCGRGRRRLTVTPSPPPPPPSPPPPPPTPPPPPPVAIDDTCAPLFHQLNNIEVGWEDRSLTGWGKTTRRPRRQRCPAGNPAPIPLT